MIIQFFVKELRLYLNLKSDFEIVGEADSGFKACELVPSIKPDIVLMDIRMDKMDGIKASRNIKYLYPGSKNFTFNYV